MRKLRKFTREQVKALAANPYTSRVDFHSIWYTDEFMMLFLERYKNGDTSYEIFSSCATTSKSWAKTVSTVSRAA